MCGFLSQYDAAGIFMYDLMALFLLEFDTIGLQDKEGDQNKHFKMSLICWAPC